MFCNEKNKIFLNDFIFYDKNLYDKQLFFLTKFNYKNSYINLNEIFKIVFNFGFKSINFNKKKILFFFILLELITNQKCVGTKSKKDILILKIRKGNISGCITTLRKKFLYNFIDTFIISVSKLENLNKIQLKKIYKSNINSFSFILKNMFMFKTIESILDFSIKNLSLTFVYSNNSFSEKLFLMSFNNFFIEK